MIVYKFGGTSVADAGRIRHAAALVREAPERPVVVVSALAGVTNGLVALAAADPGGEAGGPTHGEAGLEALAARHRAVASELVGPGEPREALLRRMEEVLAGVGEALRREPPGPARTDAVGAAGEDLSAELMAAALREAGEDARVVDARTVVRTDGRFGRAVPDDDAIRALAEERILPHLEAGRIPVLQGFVGATSDGRTTTLGRGGSDFTAALLGAALDADDVSIWTDVDGILSGDPRAVPHPRIIEEIGFEEAVEASYFGARVIHPSAAKHAVARGVALRIRNTFRPEASGTLIRWDRRESPRVAAVAYKPAVILMKVRAHPSHLEYGFLARVFEILARHRLPVDLVATSHSSTAFTIDENEEVERVREELSAFAEVTVVRDLATVTVVGHGLMEEPGMDALVFWAVGRTPVHLISQASDVSLSFLVSVPDAPEVVRRIHHALIELREASEGARRERRPFEAAPGERA